jgi:hypothetical protein
VHRACNEPQRDDVAQIVSGAVTCGVRCAGSWIDFGFDNVTAVGEGQAKPRVGAGKISYCVVMGGEAARRML